MTDKAIEFIEKLVDQGSWYISAIELEHDEDGEQLYDEAVRILSETKLASEDTDYQLVQTCGACPEQYDVVSRKTGEVRGYLRARHGQFRVNYPYADGEEIYASAISGEGCFEDWEREYYLQRALDEIRKKEKEV